MMKTIRTHYTSQDKVAILRRHLLDHVPVSDLCDEYHLHPTVFYRWQQEFFEHGAAAFERDRSREYNGYERRITTLEEKLQRKHEVLSELMEEHVQLKKNLGSLDDRMGSTRDSICGYRVRESVGGASRAPPRSLYQLAGHCVEYVVSLAPALWQSQGAQWLDPS